MTHDSIGLGEDGPTHQPVEHVASLRAIPNVHVFRPADAIETLEAWECALNNAKGPSILALTRQSLPTLRDNSHPQENLTAKGAYVLREAKGNRQVTLLATGSEVPLAVEAAGKLAAEGIAAAVVSMPSWELFREQPKDYQREVLGSAPRIAVEAAVKAGWHEWLGEDGVFIGMESFGASAPFEELYKHFGIIADAAVSAAKSVTGARG
jgi:transketolase